MKKIFAILTLTLAAAVLRAALPQPDLLAQIHFAGAQKISAAPNASAFTNEFCSAAAIALRNQTADKLAVFFAGWLQKYAGATPGGAAKLRPLFDDLQKSEWYLLAQAGADGKPQVAVAVKLDAARAKLWQDNLKAVLPAAGFESSGGWLLFHHGANAAALAQSLAITATTAPAGAAWLSLDVNWPRLAQWYPGPKQLGLPETQFTVTATDEFHINGKFFFPENLAFNLAPWRVPTNTVHQPMVSFTAVRGFAAWLQSQAWAQPYQLLPAPNQYFVWALAQIPYQTFSAVPVSDAADALAQAFARLQPVFDPQQSQGKFLTSFTLERTNNEVRLTGMPFVSPYLQAVREPAGQFLLAGAFPNVPRSQPLPQELFQRLAIKDIVFYHWEITAERMPQVLNLSQLGLLMTQHRQLGGESAAMKLLQIITPKFGNTVTEITQTGPAEMTFTRKAPGGFTAMELFVLGSWLESPDFPKFDLKLPPRTKLPKRPHPQPAVAPGQPAAK